MKIVRFGPPGKEKIGVVMDEKHCLDISSLDPSIPDDLPDFLEQVGLKKLEQMIKSGVGKINHCGNLRFGALVKRPFNIVCVRLNYHDHASETRQKLPKKPILFSKSPSSLNGPYDDIVLPRQSRFVDYEAELGVVIGKTACKVKAESAMEYVAGFTIINDVSARDIQIEEQQLFRGKSFNTFCPVGPYLVTRDEIPDPHNLNIVLRIIDGEEVHIRQKSNTSNLIFKIPELIEHISNTFTLYPGDLISTGTPHGVALGYVPNLRDAILSDSVAEYLKDDKNMYGISRFLAAGQIIEIEIDGLGIQRTRLVAEETG